MPTIECITILVNDGSFIRLDIGRKVIVAQYCRVHSFTSWVSCRIFKKQTSQLPRSNPSSSGGWRRDKISELSERKGYKQALKPATWCLMRESRAGAFGAIHFIADSEDLGNSWPRTWTWTRASARDNVGQSIFQGVPSLLALSCLYKFNIHT